MCFPPPGHETASHSLASDRRQLHFPTRVASSENVTQWRLLIRRVEDLMFCSQGLCVAHIRTAIRRLGTNHRSWQSERPSRGIGNIRLRHRDLLGNKNHESTRGRRAQRRNGRIVREIAGVVV